MIVSLDQAPIIGSWLISPGLAIAAWLFSYWASKALDRPRPIIWAGSP